MGARGAEVLAASLPHLAQRHGATVGAASSARDPGAAAAMSRPSRLQRQVLSLYRELLRAARGKPGAEARVRAEFRQHACLPRSDVLRIEYLYRRGRRQLQLLRSGHATAMGAFVRPRGPTEEPRDARVPGTPPEDGNSPRSPPDGMGSPETPPDGR